MVPIWETGLGPDVSSSPSPRFISGEQRECAVALKPFFVSTDHADYTPTTCKLELLWAGRAWEDYWDHIRMVAPERPAVSVRVWHPCGCQGLHMAFAVSRELEGFFFFFFLLSIFLLFYFLWDMQEYVCASEMRIWQHSEFSSSILCPDL